MNQSQMHLLRALELAKLRRGYCAPNPAVGAVIVKDGQVIGEGHHHQAGMDHAEVAALKKAQGDPRGATMYVSLEPCCHHGKTPPCTDAIIAAGIAEVVYGFTDPNPDVAGQGALRLTEAGIACQQISVPEIEKFYASYAHWRRTGMPFVTVKLAISMDGKTAGPGGRRVDITGPELKQHTYEWRQKSDAILTTAQTILADDPTLQVRLNDKVESKNLYFLDRDCRLTAKQKIFANKCPITVFYSDANSGTLADELHTIGVHGITVSSQGRGLSLPQVLATIGADGVHDLWVEAGGTLFQALLEANLVQRALIYVAPTWLGDEALSAFSKPSSLLADANHIRWYQCGPDAVCEAIF